MKTSASVRTLTPIDRTQLEITVAHLQPYATVDSSRYIWILLPDELRKFRKHKADKLLALEMAPGRPPHPQAEKVFLFKINPADLFRPCASSPDTTTTSCSLDVPREVSAGSEHFVLEQMMDSYRVGVPSPGYPFTAMGWSYDWDPDSATHQGVSEYVTTPGAPITDIASTTPAAFCEAHS